MKTRSILTLTLVIGLAAGAAYKYGGAPASDKTMAKKPPPPTPVTVARAGPRDMPVVLEVVGRGEAYESVTLKSRVDGQVVEVPFSAGQRVAAGDVLIRLDPSDFRAKVAQAEANLARDQALLKKARADEARYQALKSQGFISEEKVAEVRATAEATEASVQADKAALELARLQLGYATLRAPFPGLMGDKRVHPGAAVKINDTELAVLNRIRPLYVTFAVPERHLAAIRAALERGRLRVEVEPPAGGPPMLRGEVRFIDPAVDSATGTLRMKAELRNADEALAPGQFLNVALVLDTLRDAVTVPAEAVQQGPDGAFVHVVGGDRETATRRVELGPIREGLAVIVKGLANGETVVTDGHSRLVPGGKVKIRTPGQGEGGAEGGNGKGGKTGNG
jgi:multidrug efflux system membrane fusion protein